VWVSMGVGVHGCGCPWVWVSMGVGVREDLVGWGEGERGSHVRARVHANACIPATTGADLRGTRMYVVH